MNTYSPRIYQVTVTDNTTLMIEFTNREIRTYDIRPLLEIPMFALLREPAFFRSVQVDRGGYGVVWNEDIDISEYELWQNGVAVESDENIANSLALSLDIIKAIE